MEAFYKRNFIKYGSIAILFLQAAQNLVLKPDISVAAVPPTPSGQSACVEYLPPPADTDIEATVSRALFQSVSLVKDPAFAGFFKPYTAKLNDKIAKLGYGKIPEIRFFISSVPDNNTANNSVASGVIQNFDSDSDLNAYSESGAGGYIIVPADWIREIKNPHFRPAIIATLEKAIEGIYYQWNPALDPSPTVYLKPDHDINQKDRKKYPVLFSILDHAYANTNGPNKEPVGG